MYEKELKRDWRKNRQNHTQNQHPIGNLILTMLPRALGLGFRLGLFYLGLKRRAKKAGKIFEKELLAAGMDKDLAKQLKEDYMQTSHFLHQFKISELRRY